MLRIRIRSDREVPFTALLLGLVAGLLALPLMVQHVPTMLALKSLIALGLLVALYPVARRTGLFLPLAGLAFLSVATHVFLLVDVQPRLVVVNLGSDLLMLSCAVGLVSTMVWSEVEVTIETILGGTTVYLLLGVAFAMLYSIIETLWPGSFRTAHELSPAALSPGRYPDLMYFSFVTLTTLGYGDIVPATRLTSVLAVGEAICGQLYLVVLLARVVGTYVSRRR